MRCGKDPATPAAQFNSTFRVGDPLLGIASLILPHFLSGGIAEAGVF